MFETIECTCGKEFDLINEGDNQCPECGQIWGTDTPAPAYRVKAISTGFLVGNLLAGDDGTADEEACARNYKAALERLLREEYPGADVTVKYQYAQGCIPAGLRTYVELDGDHTFERHQIEEEISRDIEELSSRISVEDWYVELFNLDFDEE